MSTSSTRTLPAVGSKHAGRIASVVVLPALSAQKRAGSARIDLKAQAVHGLHAAVALDQVFHRDGVAQALPLRALLRQCDLKRQQNCS
jgi:hypothetical protein